MRKAALLLFLFLLPPTAHAVGLEVSPGRVALTGKTGEAVSAEVSVKNISGTKMGFEAYPDRKNSGIEVTPGSFTLENGSSATLKISARLGAAPEEADVSVVAHSPEKTGLAAAAGVKIQVETFPAGNSWTASISDAVKKNMWPLGAGAIVLLAFLRFFKISPRRRGEPRV